MKDKIAHRKKITILMPFFGDGGMERCVINLTSSMLAQDLNIDLILIKNGYGSLYNEIPRGVKVIELNSHNFFQTIFSLIRYLRSRKPTWVISFSTPANLFSIVTRFFSRTKHKIMVSTQVAIKTSLSTTKWKAYLRPLVYRMYNFADVVHAVSKGVARDLENFGVKESKIQVIYNPIISFDIETRAQEPVSHPWFQKKELEIPVILGVGRLVPQKDFPNLLRAFALARKEMPMRLVILGEGEGRSSLVQMAKELDIEQDFALLGFTNNPYAYMKRADLFVLSSAWEGFGNVLAEAMALGTRVVSTDCPHGPEEILKNGQYGLLVPIGDPPALSSAIIQSLKNTMPAPSKESINRFTVGCVVDKYMNAMSINKMSGNMPMVSVIIPTYNRAHVLLNAVNSVFSQTYENWELIIIDDGSSDNTRQILEKLKTQNPQVKISTHAKNQGISASRNTGIQLSRGEFIAFLDSDDEWLPQKIEKQIDLFKTSPANVGIVYTGALFINKKTSTSREKQAVIEGKILEKELAFNPIGAPSRVMIRKQVLQKSGNFDVNLSALEDWDLWVRITRDYEVRCLNEPLVSYFESDDSVSIDTKKLISSYVAFWNKHDLFNHPRWVLEIHYRRLGHRLCYYNEGNTGRKYLWKSVILKPVNFKSFFLLALSFFGVHIYRKITFFAMKNFINI